MQRVVKKCDKDSKTFSEEAIKKEGTILSCMISSDGEYALYTVETKEKTEEYLVDLKKDAYINLNQVLGTELYNTHFVDAHTVVYMELDPEPERCHKSVL